MVGTTDKELKDNCFMRQADKNEFSLRFRIAGGKVEIEQFKKIYELAEKYGQGHVHLTARQSIEIPFINRDDIEAVQAEMQAAGLKPGACGARVRTITACQGSQVCASGLIDTTVLAQEFDELYYAQEVPHKFKIGFTGCQNNCLKAEENDLGIKGAMQPAWVADKCNFCGLCARACRSQAIEVDKSDQSLVYEDENCTHCGRCVKACPHSAWQGKPGYILYFGGLFGNQIQVGRQLTPIIYNSQDLHRAVEICLSFYQKYGQKKERFGTTLNRVGWELLAADLDEVHHE